MWLQSLFMCTETHTVLLPCFIYSFTSFTTWKKNRETFASPTCTTTPAASPNMCYSAFLMCLPAMICDAPPRWHARRGDMCSAQISAEGKGSGRTCQPDCWLLTPKPLFSKHGSGKGNPCVIGLVQRGGCAANQGMVEVGSGARPHII